MLHRTERRADAINGRPELVDRHSDRRRRRSVLLPSIWKTDTSVNLEKTHIGDKYMGEERGACQVRKHMGSVAFACKHIGSVAPVRKAWEV